MSISKEILFPVCEWLLSEGRCTSCGAFLKEGRKMEKRDGIEAVICYQCSRCFVYNKITKEYRQASL